MLCTLSDGTHRWAELRREVEGISEKMLASTLRQLVADGIVHRESLPTVPPHVEYRLTARGRELMDRMLPLIEWIAVRADEIVGRDPVAAPAGSAPAGSAPAGSAPARGSQAIASTAAEQN